MLCIVAKSIDLAMFVKLHNLITHGVGERKGQTVVEFLHKTDLSQMVPGEQLHLVGHGDIDGMDDNGTLLDATQLAELLLEKGLRGDIVSIKLSGCSTGVVGDNLAPLCQRVADEILRLSTTNGNPIDVKVTGITGVGVTNKGGRVRAKDPAWRDNPTLVAEYTNIGSRYDAAINRWNKLAKLMDISNQAAIIRSASQMEWFSRSLFKELYAHNEKVVKGKKESKVTSV